MMEGLTQNAVARPSPLSEVQICMSAVSLSANLTTCKFHLSSSKRTSSSFRAWLGWHSSEFISYLYVLDYTKQ